jgi:threonine dehydrogenase-like Zn-dependent dehydrogenase
VAIDHEVERPRPDARPIIDDSLLAPAPTGISGFEAAEVNASEYDLVVIGSGPAGQKGAIAAAKAGKSVAVIDRKQDDRRRERSHRHDTQQNGT